MWEILLDFFTKLTNTPPPEFKLSLIRKTHSKFSTQGELYLNGNFFSYTIELPKESMDGSNICIVPGTYNVTKYQGSRWPFEVPLLDTKSIGRTVIEIHPANWAVRPVDGKIFLEGCIALGSSFGQDFVNDSETPFKKLMNSINWSLPVQITVQEVF